MIFGRIGTMMFSSSAAAAAQATQAALASSYAILRSKSNNLPVYLDYKNGRTRIVTIIRNISGDSKSLWVDFSQKYPELRHMAIAIKPNAVHVKGDCRNQAHEFLLEKGF
eukprot:comp5629_c0_seq1/m.5091 comp5629_c0_seq1/g.5091  ORF comp5629_c0_seq1/g.5091 comp5629_c0_seq1/m.5091 type:complete len:110 (-) comp5629_c0_seq1:10-339(-)